MKSLEEREQEIFDWCAKVREKNHELKDTIINNLEEFGGAKVVNEPLQKIEELQTELDRLQHRVADYFSRRKNAKLELL
jgi:hypothetical protein